MQQATARFFIIIAFLSSSFLVKVFWAMIIKNEHPKGFGEWKIPHSIKSCFSADRVVFFCRVWAVAGKKYYPTGWKGQCSPLWVRVEVCGYFA